MPFFNDGKAFPGVGDNLLVVSPYVRSTQEVGEFPPPTHGFFNLLESNLSHLLLLDDNTPMLLLGN
jgi:hypothetical protein